MYFGHMEIALVAVIAVLVVALVYFARKGSAAPAATAPVEPAAPVDIAGPVSLATQQALNDALRSLAAQANEEREQILKQARDDREQIMRMATEMITKASGEELGKRAEVLDATMQGVKTDVNTRLNELNTELQRLRDSSSTQYGHMDKAIAGLTQRTENLNEVLSSSQKRGQWGERLAEDILRSAGFIEGQNYSKQATIDGGGRPDYRFEMPPDRVLFMDVKFPLDQYMAYLNQTDEALRSQSKAQFLTALNGHVNALAKREYMEKSKENTIDYVLMFVPNESISSFIHEADPNMIDNALNKKVVFCTPLTLYAFLVVIRQAADSFHTERTSADIMKRINLFQKEWGKYTEAVEAVESKFKALIDSLDLINVGGTRFKMLDVQVREIEKIRKKQGISELTAGEVLELEATEDE
jgi:DNA recombination protein RmuC